MPTPSTHRLIPHTDTPARTLLVVNVTLAALGDGQIALEYNVSGAAALRLPPSAAPVRTDGLWKSTCFELFVQSADGEGYAEFNLSPSRQWAAYAFDGYRSGMRELPASDPGITVDAAGDGFTLRAELAGVAARGRIGLSAVIEETDGTKSYWALRHPPGAPDFHHPDSFALQLP